MEQHAGSLKRVCRVTIIGPYELSKFCTVGLLSENDPDYSAVRYVTTNDYRRQGLPQLMFSASSVALGSFKEEMMWSNFSTNDARFTL